MIQRNGRQILSGVVNETKRWDRKSRAKISGRMSGKTGKSRLPYPHQLSNIFITFAGNSGPQHPDIPLNKPMKQIATLLIAATIVFSACSQKPVTDDETLCVSILPLKSLVEGIVGDDFTIDVIVPRGASPETFEPTPRQFVEINKARMIFSVGLIDFETSLLGKIDNQEKVVNLSRGIELIEGSCAHSAHGAENSPQASSAESAGKGHAHGIDPHIWTSPRALQVMASNAFDAIQKAFPDSIRYRENYERLMERLKQLDERVGDKIKRSGVRYFIVYHPALTYYARDYGIQQVAIEAEGKEPSARRLARIIRQARQDGVSKIFYQNQFPESVVEVIARDIRARYIEIDPLDEQVIENIDRITDLITEP